MKTRPSFKWTDSNVSILANMWKAGRSAGDIGKALGTSRGSVMGKVFRLGLARYKAEAAK